MYRVFLSNGSYTDITAEIAFVECGTLHLLNSFTTNANDVIDFSKTQVLVIYAPGEWKRVVRIKEDTMVDFVDKALESNE